MFESQSPTTIDLSGWVLKASNNPVRLRQRQVTEILLHAVAATPSFGRAVFLKGGILMALAYQSPRNTGDVDFSVIGDPEEMEQTIVAVLDEALLVAARRTGHFDILCRVQSVVRKPRPDTFPDSPFPALRITIGSASRMNASEMTRLETKKATQVVRIDLSFREPIDTIQKLVVGDGEIVHAYGLYDLIAEKLRALLQRLTRSHQGERHQDIYDLARLLRTFDLDESERIQILATLRNKSRERELEPVRGMISDERIVSGVRASWPKLKDELEEKLPDFNKSFEVVRAFYDSLPWEAPEAEAKG